MPLDDTMKEQVKKLAKPYKRDEHESNASVFHTEESGAIPTIAHQSS